MYTASEQVQKMTGKLRLSPPQKLHLRGLVGSVDALLAVTLYNQLRTTNLFIFNDLDEAKYFAADLESLIEDRKSTRLNSSH